MSSEMPDLMISAEQFNTYLNNAVEYAYHAVEKRVTEDLIPTMIVHTIVFDHEEDTVGEGVELLLMTDFDAADPAKYLRRIGNGFGSQGTVVQCAFLVAEAWVSGQTDVRPHADPKRREVISISGMTLDKRSCVSKIAITRNKKNRMVPGAITTYGYGDPDGPRMFNPHLTGFFYGYMEAYIVTMKEETA